MSKTPRTDEHLRMKEENGYTVKVSSEFARQLETELSDKDKLIEQMRETLKALNLHLALLRPVLKVEEMPK